MSAYVIGIKNYDFMMYYLAQKPSRKSFYYFLLKEEKGITFDKYNSLFKMEECEKIIQILIDQNYRSVNFRYNEKETPPKYKFDTKFGYDDFQKSLITERSGRVNPEGAFLSLLDFYEYQSCETPDYYESEAYKIINTMRKHIVSKLEIYSQISGWFSI